MVSAGLELKMTDLYGSPLTTLRTQMDAALEDTGEQLLCVLPSIPDFTTLNFRSHPIEKIGIAEGIETATQLAQGYAMSLPLAAFVGATVAFPAFPVIPNLSFDDILSLGGIQGGISISPGELEVVVTVTTGPSIINTIIDYIESNIETVTAILEAGGSVKFSLPTLYDTYVQPTWQAIQMWQTILKDYIKDAMMNYVLSLIDLVMDKLEQIEELTGAISDAYDVMKAVIDGSNGLDRDTIFGLIENAALQFIPGLGELIGLKPQIESMVGKSIKDWKSMMCSLSGIKGGAESTLKSVQKEIERQTGQVIEDIKNLDESSEVNAIIQRMYPGLPSFAQIKQILELVENIEDTIGLPLSLKTIIDNMVGFIPAPFNQMVPEIFDIYAKVGDILDDYNFDPAAAGAVIDKRLEKMEYEFNKAWDEIVSKISNITWEQITGFIIDTLSSVPGFPDIPQPKIVLNISST
jgi:hypothetical protein